MPRKPGRPQPPGRKAKRVRPAAPPGRFHEEQVVIRARIAAAEEAEDPVGAAGGSRYPRVAKSQRAHRPVDPAGPRGLS